MCRISSNIVCDAATEKSVLDKLFLWKYTLFLQNVAVTENSTANCVWDTVQSYFYTWNRFEQGCTSSLRPQQHTTVFWVKVEDGSNGWISSPPPPLPFTEDSLQLSFKPAWARRQKSQLMFRDIFSADTGTHPTKNCLISWRRDRIICLYSPMRSFLPSMMQVLLGRGLYL